MPVGCHDDEMPWENEGDFLKTKYPFVCHAELNAILNSDRNLRGAKIYTTLFPCNECAKAIIQVGVTAVIYLSDKYAHSESVRASKQMFDRAKVSYRPYVKQDRALTLHL